MIEDKELAQLFKAESAEHLARLDDGLLHLEKTPADPALLEEVFRESHSLKGAARMLGLSKIETAAHGLETILNTARKGEAPLTPDVIERMTAVLGDLRKLVQEALGGEAVSGIIPPPQPSPALHAREGAITPGMPEEPDSFPRSRGKVGMGAAQDEMNAPTPPRKQGKEQFIAPVGKEPALSPASGGELERGQMPAAEPFRIETVRVETRKLDDLLTLVGELSVIEGRAQHRLSLMDALLEQWALLERNHKKESADFGLRTAEFGNKLKEARDAFYEDSTRLETTVNTLEDRVHAARLLPLSTVFALFPRMVHDLAKAQGKEVELAIEGGEIGVDKRILEEMKDPLMHLLRNAIDHGIEQPDERERQGKPRGGVVRLRALRENSTVLLEVRDDGHGLNLEAIKQVALKRGLHDEAALAAMTPAQLQQLIFLPGFSTSTFVTELSGRGVGLDVVRVNVEHLKGDIRLESSPQQGTVMQVRLPLSLATTRLLLAGVGDRRYGLPIEFVHTSRRVREEDIFTLEGRPAISLDGQPVIAPRLADLLELQPPPQPSPALRAREGALLLPPRAGEGRDGGKLLPPTPAGDAYPLPRERGKVGEGGGGSQTVCIVLQVGDERLGLRVDELLDEEEVVAKPLGAPLTRVRNVSGLTILGSGEICAVLNPADLLRSAHKTSAEFGLRNAELKMTPQSELRNPHSILLVEDSALVRAMEKRILEDAGYEVVAAVDGVDGLSALGRRSFAAVVSDIVMPNMDGLTLTARIRQEPRYKELPVILVTTLSSDEDKRRGLEAGANAYIPKPSFDQRVLLETLQRLIGR
ncbi:MAG TPA: hybrid sensor histidine kinase/response regulator [Gallionella sp.]|nr:hybrid sensor histidine kinase/response regulator [Gallionella sp.]